MTCKRVREFPHFQEEPSTPDASSVFTPSFVKDKFKKSPLISENDNSISLNVFDPDTLVKPVKSFIAEFVRKQLLGLSSQTIGQLLCVFISMMGVDVAVEVESLVEASLGASNVSSAASATSPRIVLEQMCKKVGVLRVGRNM